jgi:hypothetical protein
MIGAECKAKTNCALIAQFQTASTLVEANPNYSIKYLNFIEPRLPIFIPIHTSKNNRRWQNGTNNLFGRSGCQ